jgi:aminoglycoside phosphotransferase
VGRFVVPLEPRGVAAWFFGDLFVPHDRRERLVRAIARRAVASGFAVAAAFPRRAPLAVLAGNARWAEAVAAASWLLGGGGRPLLDEAGIGGLVDTLLVADYAGSPRRRTLVFVFAERSARPVAMVKVRSLAGAGAPLAGEQEAIERLRRVLPGDLAATVPAVLGWRADDEWEALLLAALPGRSIWADLHAAWRPGRRAPRHLTAAAGWLARFHAATRREEAFRLPPWEEVAGDEPHPPPWLDRLAERLARRPLPLAAGHGDYWARNVLLAGGGVSAVVDWEAARPAAPPFHDLFAFAWSYGMGFPWGGGAPAPREAFRRAFLDDNRVSRAIAASLGRYGAAGGLDAETLEDLFRLWLRTRPAGRPEGGDTWRTCERMLGEAGRSVFSG